MYSIYRLTADTIVKPVGAEHTKNLNFDNQYFFAEGFNFGRISVATESFGYHTHFPQVQHTDLRE